VAPSAGPRGAGRRRSAWRGGALIRAEHHRPYGVRRHRRRDERSVRALRAHRANEARPARHGQ
jgi:hypothetical protein